MTELAEHVARLRRSAAGLDIELPGDARRARRAGIAELLAAEGLDGPDGDASIRITVTRGAWASRGLLPPRDVHLVPTIAIQAWPVVPAPAAHLEGGLHLVASAVRRDPANPIVTLKTTSRADYVFARLEARRAGADDALFLTTSAATSPSPRPRTCSSSGAAADGTAGARDALARAARSCPGRPAPGCCAGRAASGSRPVEGWLTPDELAGADEAFVCSSVAGVLPVTRFNGAPIGDGRPGPWTLRARADREGFIVEG